MKKIVKVIDLIKGVPYKYAWDLQLKAHNLRVKGEIPDVLFLLEHTHVYTFGKKGRRENLLVDQNFLHTMGIEVYHIERGGDVTYHGPGQLIGYPIFYLERHLAGVKSFVWSLEEVLIRTLKEFGVDASRIEGLRGVWVENEKVVAIGIAVKRWVTFHGFAFNINTDLDYFNFIVPCGIRDRGVTSLSRLLNKDVHVDEVKPILLRKFEEVFEKKFVQIREDDPLWKELISQNPNGLK